MDNEYTAELDFRTAFTTAFGCPSCERTELVVVAVTEGETELHCPRCANTWRWESGTLVRTRAANRCESD